ncbi:MAG: hypothetical protein ACOCY6_02925 [Halodesulfurarchaeum sp.]
MTDIGADNTASTSIDLEVKGGVQEVGRVRDEPLGLHRTEASGYRESTQNSAAEFEPSDTVSYYHDIDGFAYEYAEMDAFTTSSWRISCVGWRGSLWLDAEDGFSPQTFESPSETDLFYYPGGVTPIQEWEPEEYEL